MTGILTKKGKLGHRKTYRRKCHVKGEAKIGETHLQAKGQQGLLVITRG